MSRKRKYRQYHWPYGIGLDKRQARRFRRRVATYDATHGQAEGMAFPWGHWPQPVPRQLTESRVQFPQEPLREAFMSSGGTLNSTPAEDAALWDRVRLRSYVVTRTYA